MKNRGILVLGSLGLVISLSIINLTGAVSGGKYKPGETLDPDCAPTDVSCSVDVSDILPDMENLSFANYILSGRSDPGVNPAPQGPVPKWQRIGDSNLEDISEIEGDGIEKWQLAPGRYELTASVRYSSDYADAAYSWFDETNNNTVGGTAMINNGIEAGEVPSNEAYTTIIKAIIEPTETTTYYIRQEVGGINEDILEGGTWATIVELPTTSTVNTSSSLGLNFTNDEQYTETKWVDGKSIYRKVVKYDDVISANASVTVDHGIDGIIEILPMTTLHPRKSNNHIYDGGGLTDNEAKWEIDGNNIYVRSIGGAEFTRGFTSVIYYTK